MPDTYQHDEHDVVVTPHITTGCRFEMVRDHITTPFSFLVGWQYGRRPFQNGRGIEDLLIVTCSHEWFVPVMWGFSHASVRGSAIRIAASVSRTTGSAHRLVIVTANAATTTMSRNYFKFGKQRGSREWGYMGVSNRLHQDVYEYDECFFDVTELSATSWS